MDFYMCCVSEFGACVLGTGCGFGKSSGMDFEYVLQFYSWRTWEWRVLACVCVGDACYGHRFTGNDSWGIFNCMRFIFKAVAANGRFISRCNWIVSRHWKLFIRIQRSWDECIFL